MTFRNLSRYSSFCEKTYSRQFGVSFDFAEFNHFLIAEYLTVSAPVCAVMDASFIPKSGKQTYGRDSFFNSAHNKPEKGLEISTLAIIDPLAHTAFTVSARQTPALSEIQELLKAEKLSDPSKKTGAKKDNRVDFYLYHLRQDHRFLLKTIRYILTDGYYSKVKFVQGVRQLGYHQIGKLRADANLRYLYTGLQKAQGAKKKYDDKVNCKDLSRMTYIGEVEKDILLYSAVVNSPQLKQNLRIALLINQTNPKAQKYVILFSTDTEIDPTLIYTYYKSRFQIEFIFRDAKQFTGLCDCQARDKDRLNFHFNASLAALNIAKMEARNLWDQKQPFSFSMNSVKTRNFNAHIVDTIISNLDLNPDLIKNQPNIQKILDYGCINT